MASYQKRIIKMIIEENKRHIVAGDDFFTIKSSINKSKLAKLYSMLSAIYRNPIGSIVREYASNAHDANVEAYQFKILDYEQAKLKYSWLNDDKFKINSLEDYIEVQNSLSRVSEREPIVVGVNGDTQMLHIQDYGIGLSPERMKYIYFNYLDSTKENNDDEIGGFGIGAKSAMSYTNTFFITSVYNKVEYEYIMTKGEDGAPEGMLLTVTEDTDKPNGTLIKIPIRDGDTVDFCREIKKQLCYMDNVIYKNVNYYDNETEYNTSKVVVGKGWKYKYDYQPMREMHLSLGNVAYSIDWTELGINSINIPFALTFQTGELEPTPSRESIVYTRDSVAKIHSRIAEFQQMIIDKHNSENHEITDFKDYAIARRNNVSTFDLLKGSSMQLYVSIAEALGARRSELKGVSFKPFTDLGITPRLVPVDVFFRYKIARRIYRNNGANSAQYNSPYMVTSGRHYLFWKGCDIVDYTSLFAFETIFPGVGEMDLVSELPYTLKGYRDSLRLSNYSKNEWRKIISGYNKVVEDLVKEDTKITYDDILPDPNWFKRLAAGNSIYSKTKKVYIKQKGSIHVARQDGTWRRSQMKLDFIEEFKGVVIYGSPDEMPRLSEMFGFFRYGMKKNYSSNLLFISVSKTNCKILSQMDNAHTIDEAFEAKLRPIIRGCTAYKLEELIKPYKFLTNSFISINKEVYAEYAALSTYASEYSYSVNGNVFKDEVLALADKLDLYDHDILDKIKVLEDYFKGIEIMKVIDYSRVINQIDIMIRFLKENKKKVNVEYYLKPVDGNS